MATNTSDSLHWLDLRRDEDDPRPPATLVVGLGLLAQLLWSIIATAVGLPLPAALIGVVVVGAVTSWWLTVPSALVMAAISFLVADGFIEGRLGVLQWDGNADVLLVLALVSACALCAEIRSSLVHDVRRQRPSRSTH